MTYKIHIIKTSDQCDSNTIHFIDKNNKTTGHGYIGKREGATIGLIRCPKCASENYGMMVSSGQCAWCGFDANQLMEGRE